MADTHDILRQLLANKNLIKGSEWRAQRDALEERRQAGDFEIDKCVPGEVVETEAGSFYRVKHTFPLDATHGPVAIGDVLDAISEHIALCACDADLDEFDPSTALFIDTETTGLAGGTGTMPFLVGVGYFDQGALQLEQCFMRDFDDEEGMLAYLDTLFKRGGTVVSFNGKSFDVPLLRTRFISNRRPFRLDARGHFDLVHAARRIWKLRLKDCSLGNIERTVMGIHRQGDVPSAEIPQMWFDYLRTRDARELRRVFYHHRMDILSLVSLTALLSKYMEAESGEAFDHDEDRLSLVRLHFRQRRFGDVVSHANAFLEKETEPVLRRECIELLAFAYKRLQNFAQMASAFDLMMREFPRELLPRVELAKYHEHRSRNLLEAKRICEDTLQYFETRSTLDADEDLELSQAGTFERRLERIRGKLGRGTRDSQS